MQLQNYWKLPVKDITLAEVVDGIYTGEAKYGFNYVVEVAIKDHKIDYIRITKNRNSFYAELAEGLIKKVMHAQNLNVGAVTGATTTSKCLLKAIENAIEKGQLK
ncbi:MAG: FMN-binding protein [bacterium]